MFASGEPDFVQSRISLFAQKSLKILRQQLQQIIANARINTVVDGEQSFFTSDSIIREQIRILIKKPSLLEEAIQRCPYSDLMLDW